MDSFDLSTFGGRLSYALDDEQYGMSQTELARRVGVKPQAVSEWVRNKNKCKQLFQVAKELNVNPEWLDEKIGPMRGNKSQFESAIISGAASLEEWQQKIVLNMINSFKEDKGKTNGN